MSTQSETDILPSQQAYSNVSSIYEKSLASHHDHVQAVLEKLTSTALKPHSNILDIGSGTGRPIAAHFANHGHSVTGIDFSSAMVELARKQVPNATFIQADMTSWEPPSGSASYDMIVVSHAFYILSIAQITSMIYKIAGWVKKDGFVVIGNDYNEARAEKQGAWLNHRGWSEDYSNIILGQNAGDGTQGREEAWVSLLNETGLKIIDVQRSICFRENDPDPDMQFFIIMKRVQDNHLIGPFPIPDTYNGPVTIQSDAWVELKQRFELDRMNRTVLDAVREEPSCRKVLYVDKSGITLQTTDMPGSIQQTSELPCPDVSPGSVDGVLLSWVLHMVPSPGDYLNHALEAVPSTGNARIIVIQAAPDNELISLINTVSQDLNLPIQHHGYLLKEAEAKFRAAGFQTINYIHTQISINFGYIRADERVNTVAHLLSKLWTNDTAIQSQIEERLKKLLKLRFVFKSSGRIFDNAVVLVAERN